MAERYWSANLEAVTNHVGTVALDCPAEQSSATADKKTVELRSKGQPRAAVPTWLGVAFRHEPDARACICI